MEQEIRWRRRPNGCSQWCGDISSITPFLTTRGVWTNSGATCFVSGCVKFVGVANEAAGPGNFFWSVSEACSRQSASYTRIRPHALTPRTRGKNRVR
jgi:hypothetical protein